MLVTEMYDKELKEAPKFYSTGADMPFNFNLVYIDEHSSAEDVADLVHSWIRIVPKGKWPNWVVGLSLFIIHVIL